MIARIRAADIAHAYVHTCLCAQPAHHCCTAPWYVGHETRSHNRVYVPACRPVWRLARCALHTCGTELTFPALLHSSNMLITLNDHPSPFCAAVKYKGVPCPVGKHGIELQFLDYSKPIPASSEICNNQFGVPCGGSVIKSPVRATLSLHGKQRHVCRAAYSLCFMCAHTA